MNPVWKLLEELAQKKGINEIVINGPKAVFVERGGEFINLNVNFTKNDIIAFVKEVADYNKKVCNDSSPIMDGSLPDGSRINIILGDYCQSFCAITIRKYIASEFSLDVDAQSFGISPRWVPFFKSMVKARKNIVISGGTGSGKTTFINMLLREVDPGERIITIEDTIELKVQNINNVRLEVKSSNNINTRELVKNTLRMRPDRIIIGEIRGGEVFDLLQAMNTGHEGSMTTVHANSSIDCLSRIETLFLLSGFDLPYHVVRKQMSQAIDFVIQIAKDKNGKRKVVQVLEIGHMEGNNILTTSILENTEGELISTGIAPNCINDLAKTGEISRDFFAKK